MKWSTTIKPLNTRYVITTVVIRGWLSCSQPKNDTSKRKGWIAKAARKSPKLKNLTSFSLLGSSSKSNTIPLSILCADVTRTATTLSFFSTSTKFNLAILASRNNTYFLTCISASYHFCLETKQESSDSIPVSWIKNVAFLRHILYCSNPIVLLIFSTYTPCSLRIKHTALARINYFIPSSVKFNVLCLWVPTWHAISS